MKVRLLYAVISIVLCFASNSVLASDNGKDAKGDNRCIFIAHTYNNSITARNAGLPPEQALGMSDFKELPVELRKKIVNQVYFDPTLKNAVSSDDLVHGLIQQCLHGSPKPFEPLK